MPNKISAKKNMRQAEKRTAQNRLHKSRVRTARTKLNEVATKEPTKTSLLSSCLSTVFKYIDKAVKTGVFKKGKGDRLKSRAALNLQKKTTK